MFANAQTLINAYLRAETGIRCVTEIPSTRPSRFIRTVRTGGFLRDPVTDVARMTVECWNDEGTPPDVSKKVAAERDAQTARAALLRLRGVILPDGTKVHVVTEVAGPSDSPDPDTKIPRYVFTHEVHLRGSYRKAT